MDIETDRAVTRRAGRRAGKRGRKLADRRVRVSDRMRPVSGPALS